MNKYLWWSVGIIFGVIMYTRYLAKGIMGGVGPTINPGLDELYGEKELAGKSDSMALNTIQSWLVSRPRAQSGLQSAGLIDVNPTNRFIPDPVSLSYNMTQTSPGDAPVTPV